MKKVWLFVKRVFKRLFFRFRHKEGWAEKRAREILGDGNGQIPIGSLSALTRFVKEIGKIEKSRKFTKTQRIHLTEWEEEKLRRYGPVYRFPCLATREKNEGIMRNHMANNGSQRPPFSDFIAHTI